MPITQYLERNARQWPDDIALVELNPAAEAKSLTAWKEYDLTEPSAEGPYRRQITWKVFDEKANRTANALLARGICKGDKVGILLMNCLEWLPTYFGILKAGAVAVPLNFRYAADEIQYCVDLADIDILIFGPEFESRVSEILPTLSYKRLLFYIGDTCPKFAANFTSETSNYSSRAPQTNVTDDDYAAIYFSSGTTGFPKAILHRHRALMHSAEVEQNHHGQRKDDVFLCIPPLYHTGAKMHWFASLYTGGRAVLLSSYTMPMLSVKKISKKRDSLPTILLWNWASKTRYRLSPYLLHRSQ